MALGRRRVEKQHFQAGFGSVRGGRLDGRSGFPSCHGLARVSPRPNAMSRRACPQPWLRLQLQHNQEGTEGPLSHFGGGCTWLWPSWSPAPALPIAIVLLEQPKGRKRRRKSVAEVEMGELLGRPLLQKLFGHLQRSGVAGGAGARLPRLNLQHPNRFRGG